MFTLEQKVDLILRYIATTDKSQRNELRKLVIENLSSDTTTPAERNSQYINEQIANLLREIGVPQHLGGYEYLVCAITLTLSDRTYLKAITTRLYPDVAERFNTGASCVERSMRHAIEVAFIRGDLAAIAQIFGNTINARSGKVTNGEFVATCVNEIARRIQ